MSETADVSRRGACSLGDPYALRELRSGLRSFYVFIACIALGVMAIAGVGSVAGSLSAGLESQGRILLGGDASFALISAKRPRKSAPSSKQTARCPPPPSCEAWRARRAASSPSSI